MSAGAVIGRLSVVLRAVQGRMRSREELRHVLELDDYLLEDMGLSRDWIIAGRRRLGIRSGFLDASGRHLVRSGVRRVRGMQDEGW